MSRRRRWPSNSAASPKTTSAKSLRLLHVPNLGDKMQRLTRESPQHLKAVELLVDLILRRIER